MAMLPRIKPRTFYDLVIEVAIVRPGPIQGDMVHPYLRRREGKERIVYPKPELEKVLGKTLGVPLFQEQAMRVAIECAGFTAGEADQLRRSMATFKFTGGVSHFRDKLINGMVKRGYDAAFAEKVFSQLEGFGSYGFPESHAASFALIAYASSWMKCHHPEAFCAALLNAQPMGFYAPAQIVRDAREHGVEVRPICINASHWDATLEPAADGAFAVRLGLRMARGLANLDSAQIVAARGDDPYASVDDLWRRSSAPTGALVQLAEADAFRPSLNLARREALWAIKGLRDEPLPLFAATERLEQAALPEAYEPHVALKPMTAGGEVVEDYGHVGLTLRQHPVAFLREDLSRDRIVTCAEVGQLGSGRWVRTAGLILVRQMPGSAKGVMFITIEDETGVANLVIWPKIFEQNRRAILGSRMLRVDGRIQREGDVVHLIAHRLYDLSNALAEIGDRDDAFPLPHGRGDEGHTGGTGPDPRSQPKSAPKPRDIFIPDLRLGSGIKPGQPTEGIKLKPRNFR
jgi:error-prone DNA polymerase